MKKWLYITLSKPSILVGGQAVIEGVMMRVPGAYATAVRNPQGEIKVERKEFKSKVETSSLWKKPIFRGVISLFEAMKMGFQTLQWSADIAMPEESGKEPSKLADWASMAFAIGLAVVMFMAGPYWITQKLLGLDKNALGFNALAGVLRISFFILYLLTISLMKDVKRLFMHHGAEHKVVYNFESGKEISIKNAQAFKTEHPRCGTSFLFIVLLSAILVFAIVDTIVIAFTGPMNIPTRLILHLPLMPLVAGVSYEIIKLTARKGDVLFFRILRAPGLWLQKITTKEPEDDMVEVAIEALRSAFGEEFESMQGKEYLAEAIG